MPLMPYFRQRLKKKKKGKKKQPIHYSADIGTAHLINASENKHKDRISKIPFLGIQEKGCIASYVE